MKDIEYDFFIDSSKIHMICFGSCLTVESIFLKSSLILIKVNFNSCAQDHYPHKAPYEMIFCLSNGRLREIKWNIINEVKNILKIHLDAMWSVIKKLIWCFHFGISFSILERILKDLIPLLSFSILYHIFCPIL